MHAHHAHHDHVAHRTLLALLFNKTEWAKYIEALPTLATWADVKNTVMALIMAAAADSLNLLGNQLRFAMVIHAPGRDNWPMGHGYDPCSPLATSLLRQDGESCAGRHGAVHHFHTQAFVQYPKFLAMAVAHPHTSLVPTSAIDLLWHTYQLAPLAYGKHTLALLGHIINHDDSDDVVSEMGIADGVKETEDFWTRESANDQSLSA
ncbi:hypothetical protein AMAG_15982 [Allomyces macrogynus ATCC 38327]|uniref:Uncharacterized protein n=1 Tax=Allomyces macrogynus (strain ATCC 38327) TaxID=578462 RepID=A0A0L0TBW7_ALLM3|nr:hypothetical protein AMAG_15982 [Allomyces macrogynus ATCC 38327]|eukprot:KNE72039.1 hypothetical protein AMAG_15982 [Allomyces macrogynus ATCC 38327]